VFVLFNGSFVQIGGQRHRFFMAIVVLSGRVAPRRAVGHERLFGMRELLAIEGDVFLTCAYAV
jgi:hypothetical protein